MSLLVSSSVLLISAKYLLNSLRKLALLMISSWASELMYWSLPVRDESDEAATLEFNTWSFIVLSSLNTRNRSVVFDSDSDVSSSF